MGEQVDNHGPVQYLRVIGRLYPDQRLKLRRGYLTSHPQWVDRETGLEQGEAGLVAELYDEKDGLLGRYPLRVYEVCGYGSLHTTRAVRGFIPFHPRTSEVRFALHGRPIHEIRRTRDEPELRLDWQPEGRVEGRARVSWESTQPVGLPLQFFLRYSHTGGQTWQRVGWRTDQPEAVVDFDQLPGGERCLLEVVATDGINTVTRVSELFAVAVKACRALVVAPVDRSVVAEGQPVILIGQGYDIEACQPELEALVWTSSQDGELGRGRALTVDRLSPGEHRITLTAGHPPRQGSESVTIRVGPAEDGMGQSTT